MNKKEIEAINFSKVIIFIRFSTVLKPKVWIYSVLETKEEEEEK